MQAPLRRHVLTVMFALVPCGIIQAQNLEDPPWVKDLAPKRIVYSVPGMERIKPRRDLIYKHVGNTDLKMDIYLPPRPRHAGRAPIVMFIHGGRVPPNLRTTPKDWQVYVSFGQLVAASGFVGVTFNHRFHQWESLNDSESDIADAIQYARGHARSFGADPDRIVLWAVSAGGIFFSQPLRDRPRFLKCLVAYYSVLDLQNERKSAPLSVTDETLRRFSPVTYLDGDSKDIPPIFIARSGLDDADLNAGIDLFVRRALEKNMSLEMMNHATGHHGFDIEDNNNRSREIIKRTLEFIREHTQ